MNIQMSVLILAFQCILIGSVKSSNILIAYVIPSKSHGLWASALSDELVARGDNVTFMGPLLAQEKETNNYRLVNIEGASRDQFDVQTMTKLSMVEKFQFYFQIQHICDLTYQSKNFNKFLLNKSHKFDLLILDLTITPCLLPLIQIYAETPVIGMVPFMLPSELSHLFGNNLQPAYVPHYLYHSSDEMTFYDRIVNFFYCYGTEVGFRYYMHKWHDLGVAKFGTNLHNYYKLSGRISLLLSNINPIFDYPQPLPPNIIPVGGIHIKKKKLSADLQQIMDNSHNGAIILSFGTNVDHNQLNLETINCFKNVFKQLNQTVIWSLERDLKDVSENVVVRKWLDQSALVGHPNTKLLIAHGGALSTQEALYYGVPVIAIPYYLDQHLTSKTLMDRKTGLQLDWTNLTETILLEAIQEVLFNPVYKKNVQRISKRFHQYPHQPRDLALKWIDYVIENNGTHFLNLKSRNMSFMAYTNLDILLLFVLIVLSLLLFFYKMFKLIVYCFTIAKIKIE